MMHVYYIRFLFIIIIIQFKLIVQKKSKEGNLIESNYSKEQNQDQAQKKIILSFNSQRAHTLIIIIQICN